MRWFEVFGESIIEEKKRKKAKKKSKRQPKRGLIVGWYGSPYGWGYYDTNDGDEGGGDGGE